MPSSLLTRGYFTVYYDGIGCVTKEVHMKYKTIEAIRETRMWIGQIFVPLITIGTVLASNEQVRNNVCQTAENAKNWVANTFAPKK